MCKIRRIKNFFWKVMVDCYFLGRVIHFGSLFWPKTSLGGAVLRFSLFLFLRFFFEKWFLYCSWGWEIHFSCLFHCENYTRILLHCVLNSYKILSYLNTSTTVYICGIRLIRKRLFSSIIHAFEWSGSLRPDLLPHKYNIRHIFYFSSFSAWF